MAARVVITAILATFSVLAEATVFTQLDDQELLHQAGWIVEGRVLGIQRAGDGLTPNVDYKIQVEQWLKGAPAGDEIILRVPGGVRADGVNLHLLGTPRLRLGDHLLLFLSAHSEGVFSPTQFFLGVFHAWHQHDGQTLAVRDFGEAHELVLEESAHPREGLRDFERFSSWLRDRATGLPRVQDYFVQDDFTAITSRESPTERFTTITSSTEPEPVGCGSNGGHRVRWFDFDGGGTVPWRGYLLGQPGLEDSGLPHLEAALEAWNQDPDTPIELEFAGITARRTGFSGLDGTNTLLFDDPNDEIGGAWQGQGILALGGPWFRCQLVPLDDDLFHPIIEGDIVTQDGLENFFATLADPPSAGQELFAHELGHTLGLDHAIDPEALMFADIHADGRGAQLTFDDRLGIRSLYGPPPEQTPPAPPNALEALVLSPTKVRLSWLDRSTNEEGFRIERRAEGPFKVLAAVTPGMSPRHLDDTAAPATTYTYRVRAQNRAGSSPWSNEVTLLTPPSSVPQAPTNLRAAPLGTDRIRLTWQDNEGAQDGATLDYEYFLFVFSPTTSSWIRIPVPLPADTRSADLVGLAPSTEYTLEVRARNTNGDSSPSNPVSARTFALETTCATTPEALCLLAGRFQVEVSFRNQYVPNSPITPARALPSTDQIGQFWFFGPNNIELVVKLIDGRPTNGHFWVYSGGITDLEVWLTITDTLTNVQRIYHKEAGEFCGEADIMAFDADQVGEGLASPSPPAIEPLLAFPTPLPRDTAPGTCSVSATTLCLLDRRLEVTLNWSLPDSEEKVAGRAVNDGEDSGAFWFFDPQNTEVVIKAIDGRELNNHFWIFFGALSNLEYEIVVTDTVTGEHRTYNNSLGNFCGQADTQAFRLNAPP